jgi:hypothetical protein
MKTPYLDSQLKGYRQLAESGKMPESGMEQLRELEAIKEALSIHDVMQSDYTPDMIAKHLEWNSYDHMKINEEHIEPQFKEAINMIFWLCKLEVPFYSA